MVNFIIYIIFIIFIDYFYRLFLSNFSLFAEYSLFLKISILKFQNFAKFCNGTLYMYTLHCKKINWQILQILPNLAFFAKYRLPNPAFKIWQLWQIWHFFAKFGIFCQIQNTTFGIIAKSGIQILANLVKFRILILEIVAKLYFLNLAKNAKFGKVAKFWIPDLAKNAKFGKVAKFGN